MVKVFNYEIRKDKSLFADRYSLCSEDGYEVYGANSIKEITDYVRRLNKAWRHCFVVVKRELKKQPCSKELRPYDEHVMNIKRLSAEEKDKIHPSHLINFKTEMEKYEIA